MKADLYNASVVVFARGLTGLRHVLDRGVEYAQANDISEADLLRSRLYPNMFPLYRQVQIACDFGRQAPARIAGLEVPPTYEGEPTLSELRAAIDDVKTYLKTLNPSQFEGRDAVMVTFPVGHQSSSGPAAQYLLAFAVQNFFFHSTTAYAILRSIGVKLGKTDYFGVKSA